MIHFLFITTSKSNGGSEFLWLEAATRALEQGNRVTVACHHDLKVWKELDQLIQKGVTLVARPSVPKRTILRRIFWRMSGNLKPHLRWWLKKFPQLPDVICVNQGGSYCASNMPGLVQWLNGSGTPFVLICHSHRAHAFPPEIYREELQQCFRKAGKVCFVAQENLKAAERYLGMKLGNAIVVQNPVNLKEEKTDSGNSEKLKMGGTTDFTDGHGWGTAKDTTPARQRIAQGEVQCVSWEPTGAKRSEGHERGEERGTGSLELGKDSGLTTEDTKHTEVAGLRLASQAVASESDSLASELADAPVSESLTRFASGSALAAEPPIADPGGIKMHDSTGQDAVGLMAEVSKLVPSSDTGDALDSRPSTLDANAPKARMACVARLEVKDKGQDLLLDALSEPVWKSRNVQLDLYGNGPDREILEDLINLYDLGDKVRIAGFESDIRKIWNEHQLLVLPSLSEGTPISLIEAQICGRAALVTRVDGNPEWVEEGKTGFLAEAPTVHHLRLALERAWENRSRWEEMGEAARAACLAKRDPDPAGTLLRLLKAAAEA